MKPCAHLRVLFRVAAGPRRGFAPVARCVMLARALGVRPLLSIGGPEDAVDTALALGADVLTEGTPESIPILQPDIVIVDDTDRETRRWRAAARTGGVMVVGIRSDRFAHGRVSASGASYEITDACAGASDAGGPGRAAASGDPGRVDARAVATAIIAADPRARITMTPSVASPAASPAAVSQFVRQQRAGDVAIVSVSARGQAMLAAAAPHGLPIPEASAALRERPVDAASTAALTRSSGPVVWLLSDPRRTAVLERRRQTSSVRSGLPAAVLAFPGFAPADRSDRC